MLLHINVNYRPFFGNSSECRLFRARIAARNVDSSIQAPWSVWAEITLHPYCTLWKGWKPDADGGWFLVGKPRGSSFAHDAATATPFSHAFCRGPQSVRSLLTLVVQRWVSAPAAATYGGSFPHTQVVGFGREKRAWPRLPGPCWPPSGILPSCRREGSEVAEKCPRARSNHASVTLMWRCLVVVVVPHALRSARRSQPSRRTTTDSACWRARSD